MSLRKYALIPQLMIHSLRAPRNQQVAWDRFWSGVGRTGPDGEVLWDAGCPAEGAAVEAALREHADLRLPLVDLGCGNGRQARVLAALAPRVLGLDRSASAVERARLESQGVPVSGSGDGSGNGSADGGPALEFRVADVAEPGLGERLHEELGDVNVHVRGVLHVVGPARRPDVVRTIEALLGRRGTAYLSETDTGTDPLGTLRQQGATATSMPGPLRRLIAAGVRPPSPFGGAEVARYFPADRFEIIREGAVTLYGVPRWPGEPLQEISGYHAVLRCSGPPASDRG